MKIFKGFLLAMVATAGIFVSQAKANDTYPVTKLSGFSKLTGQVTTFWTIDNDGFLIPGLNRQQDIGSSTQSWRTVFANQFRASTAILNVTDTFIDVTAASTASYFNITKTTTAWSNSTGTLILPVLFSSAVPGGYARNITVQSDYNDGFSSNSITGNAVIVGTNSLGNPATETINFTTAAGTGNVAFSFVQSITVTFSSVPAQNGPGSAKVAVGVGSKLGLSNQITAASDVYAVTTVPGFNAAANALVPDSQTYSAVYNTFTPSVTPNTITSYILRYHAKVSP